MNRLAAASCLRGLEPGAPRAPKARRRAVLIGLLMVLSAHFALRVWYANQGLVAGHFWDENVNVDNARALLASGRFAPANGFYPTLAYLPQVLAIRAWQRGAELLSGEEIAVFTRGRMHPHAYLVARVVCAAWSVAALALTFVLGRRLFSPAVGVVATILFAASPWHIHVSGYWKPDSLIVFMLLAVLLSAVSLVDRPDLRRHLAAGLAIGLAMSSKFTAAFTPLVVTTAAALGLRRARAPLLHLASAGLVSLVVFVLLNPQIALFFRDFGWTMRDYARHAVWEGTTRGEAIVGSLLFPLRAFANGPVAGASAAIGLAIVLFLVIRGPLVPQQRARWLIFLSFPLFFLVAYNLGTPRLKENNLVPLLPISSLLAAIPISLAWDAAGRRAPVLRRDGVAALAVALLFLSTAPRPFRYVYELQTPTTEDLAFETMVSALELRRQRSEPRIVWFESGTWSGLEWHRRRRYGTSFSALLPVERLADLSDERLDRADAEIFRADRLRGPNAEFYRRRVEREGAGRLERIAPAPFRARGPELVVLWHPASARGVVARESSESIEREVALATGTGDTDLYSLAVQLPESLQRRRATVVLGSQRLVLHRSSRSSAREGFLHLSERFALPAGTERLTIAFELDSTPRTPVSMTLMRWSLAGGRATPRDEP